MGSQTIGRRRLLTFGGILAAIRVLPGSVLLAAERKAATELIYIGTHGTQIHGARFDPRTGDLTLIGPVSDNPRPTWAVRAPGSRILYFNEETGKDDGTQGGVHALRIDFESGALAPLGETRAGAAGTTHLWYDRPSATLIAANYSGGAISTIPLDARGMPGAPTSVIKAVGSGPHRRQASPHPHGAIVDPEGKFALIADLGADRIWIYPLEGKSHRLGADDPVRSRHFAATPGSGPRHLAFGRDGSFLYLVNELTAEMEVLRWNPREGRLASVQKIAIDAPGFAGTKSASELAVSPDGRYIYAASRGANSLVAFAVDRRSGALTEVQRLPCGGILPWHFTLHQSGDWILVANRDSDALSLFRVERKSGRIADTGKKLAIPKPVFSIFVDRSR